MKVFLRLLHKFRSRSWRVLSLLRWGLTCLMFLWKDVGNGGYERVKVGLELKLSEI